MIRLRDILKEEFEDMKMVDFANKRLAGATKIASDAKEKGGPALLTYQHFVVKLPHYKEAAEGKFNLQQAIGTYNQYMKSLHKLMGEDTPDAVEFQRVVGLLEVLGELIIKHKTQNTNEILVKNKETGKKYDVKKPNPDKHEFTWDYRGTKENPNPFEKKEKSKGITESSKEDIIKDLDKVKNDLLKKVDVLVAKKKKLYSDVDIESPMSADEKKLDKEIADLFSQINQLVLQKRSLK